jgi:hypothetical protein
MLQVLVAPEHLLRHGSPPLSTVTAAAATAATTATAAASASATATAFTTTNTAAAAVIRHAIILLHNRHELLVSPVRRRLHLLATLLHLSRAPWVEAWVDHLADDIQRIYHRYPTDILWFGGTADGIKVRKVTGKSEKMCGAGQNNYHTWSLITELITALGAYSLG